MKLTLRLITIICYFLPCIFFLTTCNNGINFKIAYNQEEADKNMLEEPETVVAQPDTSHNDISTKADTVTKQVLTHEPPIVIGSDSAQRPISFADKVLKVILMPADKSLSGIGAIFYFKNLTGKIALGLSLVNSLILLFAFGFIKSGKVKLYLLWGTTLLLIIFIVDSLMSHVTLLYGTWSLLVISSLQIFMEHRKPIN
ncbi:MAG: hypothetical protein QM726_19940 [Chitinophagaceae bacterium]